MKDANTVEELVFIHYDKGDHLYYDHDGSLMKKYVEDKCKLLIRNIPDVPLDSTPTKHTITQLETIMKHAGCFENEPRPDFIRNPTDIELTFMKPHLADEFCLIVTQCWKKKENIPVGFERMMVRPKLVYEPRNFKGKFVRIASGASGNKSSIGRRQYNENRFDVSTGNWKK